MAETYRTAIGEHPVEVRLVRGGAVHYRHLEPPAGDVWLSLPPLAAFWFREGLRLARTPTPDTEASER